MIKYFLISIIIILFAACSNLPTTPQLTKTVYEGELVITHYSNRLIKLVLPELNNNTSVNVYTGDIDTSDGVTYWMQCNQETKDVDENNYDFSYRDFYYIVNDTIIIHSSYAELYKIILIN